MTNVAGTSVSAARRTPLWLTLHTPLFCSNCSRVLIENAAFYRFLLWPMQTESCWITLDFSFKLAQLAPASIVGRPIESLRHRRIGSSPVPRRSSADLAKTSGEGWLVSETRFQRNFEQRPVGVQQQRLGGSNSSVQQVASNRNAEGSLESTHEAARRQSAFCCKNGKRNVAVQVFIQQFDRSILLPDRQPSGDNLRRIVPILICPSQMRAKHHDHFVDHQTRELKRAIGER
jgi:hypothetical protein